MVENSFVDGDHTLPSTIPYVRMRAGMNSLVTDGVDKEVKKEDKPEAFAYARKDDLVSDEENQGNK